MTRPARIFLWIFGLIPLLTCNSGYASQTLQANMQVKAVVVPGCTELSTSSMNFDNYPQGSLSSIEGTATIRVKCSDGVSLSLDADPGTAFDGATRQMLRSSRSRGSLLRYELYTSGAFSEVWGTGAGGVEITDTGTGLPQEFTIFGRIPPGQNPSLGAYFDIISVTLVF